MLEAIQGLTPDEQLALIFAVFVAAMIISLTLVASVGTNAVLRKPTGSEE